MRSMTTDNELNLNIGKVDGKQFVLISIDRHSAGRSAAFPGGLAMSEKTPLLQVQTHGDPAKPDIAMEANVDGVAPRDLGFMLGRTFNAMEIGRASCRERV